jgi:small subunit ribosomal protein S20
MPNTANAKKAMRQTEKRRLHNRALRTTLRNLIKRCRVAIAAGEQEAAKSAFQAAVKKLDQSASKNLIHKNSAARTKSRLSKAMKTKFAG